MSDGGDVAVGIVCGGMKRLILFVLVLMLAFGAHAQYFSGLKVASYKIASARPTGLRSVKGSVLATIGNSEDRRTISGITTTIYRNGQLFAIGACDDLTITPGTKSYTFNGDVKLADDVSIWTAIKVAFSFKASEYTLDFKADITHPDGKVDHVVRSRMPLTHYLKRK